MNLLSMLKGGAQSELQGWKNIGNRLLQPVQDTVTSLRTGHPVIHLNQGDPNGAVGARRTIPLQQQANEVAARNNALDRRAGITNTLGDPLNPIINGHIYPLLPSLTQQQVSRQAQTNPAANIGNRQSLLKYLSGYTPGTMYPGTELYGDAIGNRWVEDEPGNKYQL